MSTILSPLEVDLPWNGDFTFDDTGDLVLAADTPTSPDATTQRLVRLLFTSPLLKDRYGNPIAWPDDLFHPTWGAGLRAWVDSPFDDISLETIRSDTMAALLKDPGVSPSPAPQVTFQRTALYEQTMTVAYQPTTGSWAVLPTLNLTELTVIATTQSNGG